MSDSPTSFSTSGDHAPRADADPLAGDWSQGLPGPIRALGVPEPRRLALEGVTAPPAPRTQPAAVEAPGGWEEAGGAPLQSLPSRDGSIGEAPPSVIVAMDASLPTPASQAAPEPSAPVEPGAAQEPPGDDALPPADAPTPWSEAVAQPAAADALWPAPALQPDVTETWTVPPPAPASAQPADAPGAAAEGSWEAAAPSESAEVKTEEAWPAPPPAEPADEEVEVIWSAPPAAAPAEEKGKKPGSSPPAEPVQEWQPEAPASDFAPVAQPEAAPPVAPAWSPAEGGPDWSAPPEAGAAAEEDWGSAPPAAGGTASSSGAVAPDWSAGGSETGAQEDWSAPAPAPASGPAWNAPAAGASALEQLESDPPDPEPGAAQELFGTVPMGASLSGEDDDQLGAPVELAAPEDVLRPVEAPSELLTPIDAPAEAQTAVQAPEDFLMPVNADDDPDLPVAMDDAPRAKTLAVMRPANAGALEVFGEHRVAVHTRGGRTLRGTVRDIDLSKAQFPLLPQGGGEAETIYHSDVKVIFFMLAPGEKVKPAEGGKVRVKLSDGRVIEGGRDGGETRHGFFLVPGDAARTNTRRIYVAREAAEEIED